MTYIPYLGTFFFSRYPSVALARNINLIYTNKLYLNHTNYTDTCRSLSSIMVQSQCVNGVFEK